MSVAHLHTHSEFSVLDGLSTCNEIAGVAAADDNPAVAITDHGICSGHPEFQRACLKAGVNPILGMETYFVPERTERPGEGDKEAQASLRENRHLILLAMNDKGLHDLWALSTEAYASGFYYKPRCDWDLLEKYGSDLIVTTSCLGGVISQDILAGRHTKAAATLSRLQGMFPGRLYLELQPNGQREQIRLNKYLVQIAQATGLPLIAAADAHYPSEDQADLHKTWMACQTSKANEDYWNFDYMMTGAGLRDRLSYLDSGTVDEAIATTLRIAGQCTARIGGHASPPVFTEGGTARDDALKLLDLCTAALTRIRRHRPLREYMDQLEREWRLVADKELAGCYLIVNDFCQWSRGQGVLTGFRGSATASVMSYLLGITYIDPLQYGLMFERFLTPGRTSLPDFDLDLPSSFRKPTQDYVIWKYGDQNVVRVGTNTRYRNKGILQKLFTSVYADETGDQGFADSRVIAGIIDELESHTAGLGLSWDDAMEQGADALAPYIERYPRIFAEAAQLAGRVHTAGKHPAGLVISTSAPLAGQIPMRTTKDGTLVSQWDYRDLDALGLLKLDFLTIRTIDTVQEAIRLVEKRTGHRPDPTAWSAEYDDPQVWDEIGSGNTLGCFQIETSLGQQTCRRMKPRSIAELAALVALVRPGPRNSGMSESYFRRRAGQEEITYPHPRLEPYLKDTLGIMLFQENVMQACTELAGYSGAEADEVRSILGKKKKELMPAAGEKFIARCQENGLTEDEANSIWEQMSEWAKYGFNIAHAVSYAVISYWTAWLKTHYPVDEFTAILSTLDNKDRIPAFVTDARRLGCEVLAPSVNSSASGFRPEGLGVRYGVDAIKGIGPAASKLIGRGQPYASYQDFATRSQADAGVIYALARAGALDDLTPSRRALIRMLDADRSGEADRCIHKDELAKDAPNNLPCVFDWSTEKPIERKSERTGKPLKPKVLPFPKRCTRACRHYTPPEAHGLDGPEYHPARIWQIEHEVFGTWLSDFPFRALDSMGPTLREQAREMARLWPALRPGSYPVPGVSCGARLARTRSGNTMAWLTLATEVSYLDCAVFTPRDDGDPDLIQPVLAIPAGTLVLAQVARGRYRTPDGTWRDSARLESIAPLTPKEH